jgi:hypothetical protein
LNLLSLVRIGPVKSVKGITVKDTQSRRAFIGGAGGTVAAAAALAVVGVSKPDNAPSQLGQAAPAQDAKSSGYQLTEHVRRYYQTAMS